MADLTVSDTTIMEKRIEQALNKLTLHVIPDPDPGSRSGTKLSFDLLRTDIKDSIFARS